MVYVFPIEREPQKAIIASAVVFSLLPTASVVLRMVARSRLKDRKLDLSDWLIVLACVSRSLSLIAQVSLHLCRDPSLTNLNPAGRRSRLPGTCSRLRRGWGHGLPHD